MKPLMNVENILKANLEEMNYKGDINIAINQLLRTMMSMLRFDIKTATANNRLFLEMKCYSKLFEVRYLRFELGLLEEEIKAIERYVCIHDR